MSKLAGSQEILRQLGGRLFLAMTGASNLLGGSDPISLSMKLGSGARSPAGKAVTHVRIVLGSDDLYEVEFLYIRGTKTRNVVNKETGVYCDNLREIFTANTGFATSL